MSSGKTGPAKTLHVDTRKHTKFLSGADVVPGSALVAAVKKLCENPARLEKEVHLPWEDVSDYLRRMDPIARIQRTHC